ncbi:hypothetical protein BC628DRAFT_1383507 [Trametes gibbosa]|nr:hypothetical protein BC628DRAFT_1383507 [Trametes gibbosa]
MTLPSSRNARHCCCAHLVSGHGTQSSELAGEITGRTLACRCSPDSGFENVRPRALSLSHAFAGHRKRHSPIYTTAIDGESARLARQLASTSARDIDMPRPLAMHAWAAQTRTPEPERTLVQSSTHPLRCRIRIRLKCGLSPLSGVPHAVALARPSSRRYHVPHGLLPVHHARTHERANAPPHRHHPCIDTTPAAVQPAAVSRRRLRARSAFPSCWCRARVVVQTFRRSVVRSFVRSDVQAA